MPVCDESSDDIDIKAIEGFYDPDGVERLYRAVAEGTATSEILDQIYDLFGSEYQLSPPATILRLVNMVQGGAE